MSHAPHDDAPPAPAIAASWAGTHPGAVRPNNQDRFVDRPDIGLWAVADGAGGHAEGEVAAGMLAETLEQIEPVVSAAELLAEVRARIAVTHDALRHRAAERSRSSGEEESIVSTIVVLLAAGAHHACLWAGDSRAYRLRDGVLLRLTHDHSLVQDLIDAGELSEAQAERHPYANVITRAIGVAGQTPELDKVTGDILPGDRFLLCSDGLTRALAEADIAAVLAGAEPSATLIDAALRQGARDNVTAVVVAFA